MTQVEYLARETTGGSRLQVRRHSVRRNQVRLVIRDGGTSLNIEDIDALMDALWTARKDLQEVADGTG